MHRSLTRREMIKGSMASAAFLLSGAPLSVFGGVDAPITETPVPFLDRFPTSNRTMVHWDQLTEWMTPSADFFAVSHYGMAKVDAAKWVLEVTGLVRKPRSFTLDEIKSMRRKEVIATLECSGNGSSPTFMGAVGNTRWTGTPLASLLKECGLERAGIEVVFFGADEKSEKIKENDYVQNFARSLSVEDALQDRILLAYEMNGKPLEPEHGYPLRLIVPGWYGIAWVKWLKRIEVRDRRFMGRFMARDYVTIRGEERPDGIVWHESSVTRLNVKSVVARVLKREDGAVRITGAAWTDGTLLKQVELKIDDGQWLATQLHQKPHAKYAWTFWDYTWNKPEAGEHTVVSRATDSNGVIQPAADDPSIKLKKTYYEANQQYPRRIRI
jgi:DMSO/TMAO reductase YedYZ molybdopterin-dependent catalytic subunit